MVVVVSFGIVRPEIFDFETDLGLKLGQTKPDISGTAPTNCYTTIPNDSGPNSACFDDDPKLLKCEIAQLAPGRAATESTVPGYGILTQNNFSE